MPKSITKQASSLHLSDNLDAIEQKHRALAERFAQELTDDDVDDGMDMLSNAQLSLHDYLTAVKMVIDDTFDHEVWVRAEIRAMNSKGGHYYFELADKDDAGQIIASCRATLWRYKANALLTKFAVTTGQNLQAGINVLMKCSANFHAQYGFSLNISDIDPNYTLGELAAAYHAMKQRLHQEGLFHLNKSLPTPFDIRHVVVIAPEQAAGLGDFRAEADRLMMAKACHFQYHHATFQGNHAPKEIRQAIMASLNDFRTQHDALPDLLVIIRGGGAVGDLAYLNDYELAAMVAECPVPVWVGVGHQRDLVILDEVAHRSFDTPSKVILGIETHLAQTIQLAKQKIQQIQQTATQFLTTTKQDCERKIHHIRHHAGKTTQIAKQDSKHQLKQLHTTIKHRSKQETLALNTLMANTKKYAHAQLAQAKKDSRYYLNEHKKLYSHLTLVREQCRHLQSLILIQHPQRTLQKGYALIYDDAKKPISSRHMLNQGQTIHIALHDGQVSAQVQSHLD